MGANRRRVAGLAVGLACIVAACDGGTGLDCATVDPVPFSIKVRVSFPASTAGPPPEPDGVVTGNAYSEPMTIIGSQELYSMAPLGTYDVSVTAEGFEAWTETGVRTKPGPCGGFSLVSLTADLGPAT